MAEGWIKLHRSIRKNWIWQDALKLKWWLDILLQANHQERKILLGNELIDVERGSFHTSEIKLSERWDVDRKTVRRFLKLLEKDNMISVEKSKKGTTIKVSNYNDFQDISQNERDNKRDNEVPTEGTTQGTDKSQISPNKRDTNKNDKELYKNYKNEKNGEKEEEIPQPPSIPSKLSKVENIILNYFGDITYKTWFANCKIIEKKEEVEFIATGKFVTGIITQKYKDTLEKLFSKKIIVREE